MVYAFPPLRAALAAFAAARQMPFDAISAQRRGLSLRCTRRFTFPLLACKTAGCAVIWRMGYGFLWEAFLQRRVLRYAKWTAFSGLYPSLCPANKKRAAPDGQGSAPGILLIPRGTCPSLRRTRGKRNHRAHPPRLCRAQRRDPARLRPRHRHSRKHRKRTSS